MQIDKSNWIPYILGDVTIKKEENDKAKASTDFDKFLKVEHLDAENLNVKRWGKIGEDELPPTFYKIFRKGQILYPTRNPHLKRVALASFDGICGEKTLTLEPIQELIDERLYPFLFLAHSFFNHTTKSIIGSTNPHVRWRDVAQYKFLLPPKDQQTKFAELLWTADSYLTALINVMDNLKQMFSSLVNEIISEPKSNYCTLQDISSHRKGLTYRSEDYCEKNVGLPLINLKSIEKGGGFNEDGIKYYNGKYTNTHIVRGEDLIIACTDITRDGNVVGFPLNPKVYQNKTMLFTMDLIALEVNKKLVLRDYLYYLLRTNWAHTFLYSNSAGTTVLHLNIKSALKLKIPKISIDSQLSIVNKIKRIESEINYCNQNILSAEHIQKQLINRIFSE